MKIRVKQIPLLLILLWPCLAQAAEFKVDASGHHLLLNDKPFFWLADTVWLLAQVPSRDELELYLSTREKQGFTVIQLPAVMSEERVSGTARASALGDKPFLNDNPATLAVTPGNDPGDPAAYDYWDHLDYVIEQVHAHGLRAGVVVMFVGWGGDGYKYLKKDTPMATDVWHFDSLKAELTQHWKQALNSPGARNLITLRTFFDSVAWPRFIPDPRLLAGSEGSGTSQNCAMRTAESDAFVFYLTTTNQVTLSLGPQVGSANRSGKWVNPATGEERQTVPIPPQNAKVALPSGWMRK